MENNLATIRLIKEAVLELKQKNEALEEKLQSNESKIHTLENDIKERDEKIQVLQKKWDDHKNASVQDQKSSDEGKVTMSETEMRAMVDEIDKCIALLKDKNE